MNIKDISTQLIYTTVPVYAKLSENKISTGTGFIFAVSINENSTIPLMITNYHVISGAIEGKIEIHLAENGMPSKDVATIVFDSSVVDAYRLGALDLVALPLAGAINDMQAKGKMLFYRSIDISIIPAKEDIEKLAALEDITFIGYPNAIYDQINKIPVTRHGITATPIWSRFQGNPEFLIDAGVFPGSSGSPVFIYNRGTYPISDGIAVGNRLLFVGVLKETLKRKDETGLDYLDLGVVINSEVIRDELDKLVTRLTGNSIFKKN